MSTVFLVGFMGAGKSTVGRLLASKMGLRFVDLDEVIVARQRMPITRIFAEGGEAAFREMERDALGRVVSDGDAVVSCGGGVVTDAGSRAILASGTVVYLTVSWADVTSRLAGTRGQRPLLAGSDPDLAAALLESRLPLYEAVADLTVTTCGRSAAEVAERVAAMVRGDAADEPVARVATPGGSYDVLIGDGLLDSVGAVVAERTSARRCALVSDDTVVELFGRRVEESLRAAGFRVDVLTVPAGERSKSWAVAGGLLERMSEAGIGRDAMVVALGGGVVGDLAGFCAATYLRGLPVVQMPTTMLAQADSSIGGKTGVDLPRGKNLAGAFWQPLCVVSDPAVLGTLPEDEWLSGLAEVAKSAVLSSVAALERLEADIGRLAGREPDAARRAVRLAAAFKARVVSGDEREAADRESLNYGHTFGHALERYSGYGTIPHGAAVADGIRFAALLAERMNLASGEWRRRQEALLDGLGLDRTKLPCDPDALLDAMRADKKVRGGAIRFVLTSGPGEWRVVPVDETIITAALREWCS